MKGTARGGVAVFGAQMMKSALRFALQVALARLLLPADFGLVAMISPLLALVSLVAELGLAQAVMVGSELNGDDAASLFWLGIAVNLVAAALVMVLAPVISLAYREPRLTNVTIALALLIPVAGLATQPSAMLSRELRFGALALVDVATPLCGTVVGFVAAWFGLGYWALVLASATEATTVAALSLILSLSLSPWRPGTPKFRRSALSLLRVGSQIAGYNLAQYLTTTADNILLGLWRGAVTLGFYDKAYKTISQATSQLINPVARILVPLLARLVDDPEQYRRVFIAMLQLVTIAAAPGLIYAGIMADPLMRLLLGPNWDGIGPTTSWLCLGGVVAPVYASTYWLFLSQNRASEQLRSGLVVSAVSVASFVAGLPWGAAGVAAGSGLSMFLLSVPYACRTATRSGPVSVLDMVRALLPLGLAGAASCVVMLAVLALLPDTTLVVLTALPVSYLAAVMALASLPDGRRLFGMARQLANRLIRDDAPTGGKVPSFPPPVAASAGQAIDL